MRSILVALYLGLAAGGASAQAYPIKPGRMIVGFPLGTEEYA